MAILTLALFLAGLSAGWTLVQSRPQVSAPETAPSPATVAAPLPPAEDVPGEEVPGLPRYPDSVRVGYERGERDGLVVIRARYLTTENLDAVRGFYRGVFQSEGWEEADAAFYADGWTFYVTNDEREATVGISDLGPSVEVSIEASHPLPEETNTTRRTPDPAPSALPPPQQYAPSPPQYAPVPGDDFEDDDFGDDGFGDADDFGDD